MLTEAVARSKSSRHVGIVNDLTHASTATTMPTPRERAARIESLMGLMRDTGDLMTPQAMQVVMRVFLEPGITMQTLEKRTGLSLASVSRNLMSLGEWHRLGKPGLNLLESVDDPQERRRKIVFLTPKGRKFVSQALSLGLPAEEAVEVEAPTANEYLNKVYRGR